MLGKDIFNNQILKLIKDIIKINLRVDKIFIQDKTQMEQEDFCVCKFQQSTACETSRCYVIFYDCNCKLINIYWTNIAIHYKLAEKKQVFRQNNTTASYFIFILCKPTISLLIAYLSTSFSPSNIFFRLDDFGIYKYLKEENIFPYS